jgi:tetratricopeptide (TPR) repeat protein
MRGIPSWQQQSDIICERIANASAKLKVILKIKDDFHLFPIWLQHYEAFLAPHEIIIADNSSADSRLLNLYGSMHENIVVFSYSSVLDDGFHNVIHSRVAFHQLYSALDASSNHHIFLDADELLILWKNRQWTRDRETILEVLSRHGGRALATAWLETVPLSLSKVFIGPDDSSLRNSIAWGKPLVPAYLTNSGYPIHNGHFEEEVFAEPNCEIFALLHLKNYSPEQRLAVSRAKLVARGLAKSNTTFSDIADLVKVRFGDPTANRIVQEVYDLVNTEGGAQHNLSSSYCIEFLSNGAVECLDDRVGPILDCFFSDLIGSQRGGFEIARSELGGVSMQEDKAAVRSQMLAEFWDALARRDLAKALKLARLGMQLSPDCLDRYGDPLFCKEGIRLALALGQFEEAHKLAEEQQLSRSPGWSDILFGRAYEQHGQNSLACRYWKRFLLFRPGDGEAEEAVSRLISFDQSDADPIQPAMTASERKLYEKYLQSAPSILEFGAGGSTVLAGKLGVKNIVSVESDASWLERISYREELKNVQYLPFYVDIGVTGEWGYPTELTSAPRWPNYYNSVWAKIDQSPNLVLVDGRFRVACVLSTLLHLDSQSVIVIHDFWDRPFYHVVLPYLVCIDRVDNIGVFRSRDDIDWRSVARDMAAYALDPR